MINSDLIAEGYSDDLSRAYTLADTNNIENVTFAFSLNEKNWNTPGLFY